jgi:hypothetical protein
MPKPRLSFLPIFLAALALIVAVAVVARIRAYDASTSAAATTASSGPIADAAARDAASRGTNVDPLATGGASSSQVTASSDPGVVVPVDTSNAAATRQQRFRELLSAPLPATSTIAAPPAPTPHPVPVVAPPKPPEQSAFSRLVAPIAKAVNSVASAAGRAMSGPSTSAPKEGGRSIEHPAEDPAHRADPNDKTSDSQPPQLLGIEFSPPQVQDGQESMLLLTAMDDLSGVRNISGSVTSPTGKALQGFAAQREGETNRFIGRIQIPRDAEEGAWHINFLSLSDNASNTANLTFAQSALLQNALLRVTSSRPDSTPPTVKNVWLDKRAMNAGEKNTMYVQAVDDKSGVNLVTGVLLSPTGLARLGFGCHATENDVWACEITTPKKIDCGEWKLEQIQLQDKANNMGTDRSAVVTAVRLSIMGEACDATPPEMRSFALEPIVVSNVEQSSVHVTAIVTDEGSGVSSVSGQVAGPAAPGQQPPRLFFSLRPSGDGQTWVGDIIVPKLASKGTWNVIWAQAIDEAHNLKSYSRSDAVLANAAFTVR